MKLEELPIKGQVMGGWACRYYPRRLLAIVYDIETGVFYSSYPPVTEEDDYMDVKEIGDGHLFDDAIEGFRGDKDALAVDFPHFCKHFRLAEKEHLEDEK